MARSVATWNSVNGKTARGSQEASKNLHSRWDHMLLLDVVPTTAVMLDMPFLLQIRPGTAPPSASLKPNLAEVSNELHAVARGLALLGFLLASARFQTENA